MSVPAAPMSAATRRVVDKVRRMIPPLRDGFHKGQLGRVGVIGGSEDYTGAPYFSAMASARLGCDMSHVICTPSAAAVIKTYSPNLMVHPLMRQTAEADADAEAERIAAPIIDMLSRLHVIVVGPGLGRDPLMQATVARVVAAARKKKMPLVIDADALQLVGQDPGLVKGYPEAVLTPNLVEFGRLWKALRLDGAGVDKEADGVEKLAEALGGVTVIQKGERDVISNGRLTLVDDLPGSRKRSGGQGDTLTGAVATFLAWRKAYLDRLWSGHQDPERLPADEAMLLAAFGGSAITRESSRLAFATSGRSLQASDLTDNIHAAFMNLFGETTDETSSTSCPS